MAAVVACYGIVVGALLAYGLTLARSRERLVESLRQPPEQDPG